MKNGSGIITAFFIIVILISAAAPKTPVLASEAFYDGAAGITAAEAVSEETGPDAGQPEVPEEAPDPLPDGVSLQPDGTWLLSDGRIFDPVYYAYHNLDVLRIYGSRPEALLSHYLEYGIPEGRLPSAPAREAAENAPGGAAEISAQAASSGSAEKNTPPAALAPAWAQAGQEALRHAQEADRQLKAMGTGAPYRLLCIGNSITRYGYNDIWWGYWGMGATSREKDYFHILSALLSFNNTVTAESFSYTMWESPEMFGMTRDSVLPMLAEPLAVPYDAVVLQLGENITETKNLNREYRDLINYIRKLQPSARIVVVGDFWPNAAVERTEKSICREFGIPYVDLSDIRGARYHLGLGTVVSGDDGQTHTVSDAAVAIHPNDDAMMIIAQRINAALAK